MKLYIPLFGSTHRCDNALQGEKKVIQLVDQIAQRSAQGKATLRTQAAALQGDLQKVMRCFGRQCRGQSRVFLKLVRQTERHLLEVGDPVMALAQDAKNLCVWIRAVLRRD